MKKTKFTKGPWKVGFNDGSGKGDKPGKGVWIITGDDEFTVVEGDEYSNHEVGVIGKTQKEKMANAHLIAAAPELYDACNIALGHCKGEAIISKTNPEEDWETERDMLAAFLEKVLAKARGENEG